MLQPDDSSQGNNGEDAAASLRPMDFTEILDRMFSLYRSHFRLFLSICSVYFVVGLAASLLNGISMISLSGSGQSGMAIGIIVIDSLLTSIVMFFVTGALVFASAQAYLGNDTDAPAAFRQAKRRFWHYFGTNLLYGLVVGLLMITCIGIPFALFFGVRWLFCSLGALFEEKSAVGALKRSSELVKGGWWRVFGIMIGIFLLVFFVQFIIQFSLLFVLGLTQATTGDGDLLEMLRRMFTPQLTSWREFAAFSIQNFISIAVTSLMLPVAVVGMTLVYFDQRIRKEAFDIEMRVTHDRA